MSPRRASRGFSSVREGDLVAFPHTILPLHIGRKKSVNALAVEDVAGGRKPILLVTQKNSDTDPSPEAIYRMGTLAKRVNAARDELAPQAL
jgi:ATP-dependent Lon protease